MNLAIVIGISHYDKQKDLSACKNDANYFYNILNLSGKYENILYINQDTDSNNIMNKIDDFISEYSNSKINEFIIYFSGHGYYNDNEFYFCTSDVDVSNINSTSISNTNLDRIIRKTSPNTYVKIIDACESGNSYIKNLGNKEYIFRKNYEGFKNCYFFSSSTNMQNSYASDSISYFTQKFIELIKKNFIEGKQNEIKYRQISGYLADEFANNSIQTPFFVLQGSLSEIFISNNEQLESYLNKIKLESLKNSNSEREENGNIEDVNKLIPTQDEAEKFKLELIENLKKYSDKDFPKLLKKYGYKMEVNNIPASTVFNRAKIGNWLLENKDKLFVFAKEKYSRKQSKNAIANIASMLNDENVEYEISSFKLNVNESESIYQFELFSETHLPRYCCQLVIMYSLTKIYTFYDFSFSYPKNWEEYSDYTVTDKVSISCININDITGLNNTKDKILTEFFDFCNDHTKKYLEVLFENK